MKDDVIELRAATSAVCGGKAGTLGRLMRAGVRVPDGYVLLPGDPPVAGFDGVVAVRSSASTEDTADASAAGQYDSVLGVRGADAVAEAVRACRESLWSARAVAYRRERGLTAEPVMAVLVQRQLDADVAGVAFTSTGGAVRIEAAWGLGESVVHGLVTPDAWTVLRNRITARSVGDQRERVDPAPAGGTVRTSVASGDRPCLTDEQVHRVAGTARRVEEVLGFPVDVEWALVGDEIWVLQARPVTAALPAPVAPGSGPFTGTPGSPGTATGPARVLRGPGDFARVRPGDVLVCRSTDPAWTPLFAVAAAIVTETGGVLSHAAIVAREHRIPAVLGVAGAMAAIPDGRPVTVHGDRGAVLT